MLISYDAVMQQIYITQMNGVCQGWTALVVVGGQHLYSLTFRGPNCKSGLSQFISLQQFGAACVPLIPLFGNISVIPNQIESLHHRFGLQAKLPIFAILLFCLFFSSPLPPE